MKPTGKFLLILIISIFAFAGCGFMPQAEVEMSIEHKAYPIKNDQGGITSYESFLVECQVEASDPSKKVNTKMRINIKNDCREATFTFNADEQDPTHAQTQAADVQKSGHEVMKEGLKAVTEGLKKIPGTP